MRGKRALVRAHSQTNPFFEYMERQMAKKTKKKNPSDATMRNVRAVWKRIAALEKRVKAIEDMLKSALFMTMG